MSSYLPCVEIEPLSTAQCCVIWLHGLGADGNDFAPIIPELNLPSDASVRFVFPNAPQRPITINNGYVMPGWFDILSFEREARVDEEGIFQSVEHINALIEREHSRGIPAEKIILAGFSQGGVIAMHTALRHTKPLGGLLVLSSYLPAHKTLAELPRSANLSIPIFMAHGSLDPVLPIALGQHSRELLIELGYQLEWHEYPMEHSVCPDEISAISRWLCGLPALALS